MDSGEILSVRYGNILLITYMKFFKFFLEQIKLQNDSNIVVLLIASSSFLKNNYLEDL